MLRLHPTQSARRWLFLGSLVTSFHAGAYAATAVPPADFTCANTRTVAAKGSSQFSSGAELSIVNARVDETRVRASLRVAPTSKVRWFASDNFGKSWREGRELKDFVESVDGDAFSFRALQTLDSRITLVRAEVAEADGGRVTLCAIARAQSQSESDAVLSAFRAMPTALRGHQQ